jgi:chromosome segregation ATPase
MAVDPQKALLYKRYLAKSAKRMLDRDVARERLQAQIDELRKIDSKGMQAKIDELERRIADAVSRETTLRTHHQMEDLFHRKLRDRMSELEGRIDKYLKTRESRLQRITELEEKIAGRLSNKNEMVEALRIEIVQLEKMSQELEGEPKSAKKLNKIQDKIKSLKKDIEAKAAS